MRTRMWRFDLPAIAAWLVLVSGVQGDSWPAYQRDARRSAVSEQELTLPLAIAWIHSGPRPQPAWPEPGRTPHPLDFDGADQPVAAEGMVFFGSSSDDTLYALRATDGSIGWTFTADGPIRFAPQISEGRCFFASDDGRVYCLDAGTGEEIWRFQAVPENRMVAGNGRMISRWPCRSGVLVLDGTVYATAGMWPSEGVYYYALDAADGRVKWCQDTLNALYLAYPHDGLSFGGPTPQGYLLSDGEVLVVPTGHSAPAVLDAKTGQFLHWRQQSPGSTWASLGDGFVMVSGRGWQPDQEVRLGEAPLFLGDGVAFYDLATGEVTGDAVWRSYDRLPGSVRHGRERWRGQVSPLGGRERAVLAGDRLYASGMGVVEALDRTGDKLERRWMIEHPRAYALAVAGDLLLVGSDRCVSVIDSSDGRVRWRGSVNGQARGLAIADGRLVVTTDRGTVYAFAAGSDDAKVESSRVESSRPSLATPTGFALVVGSSDVRLARELAADSQQHVICLLPAAEVAEARRSLLGRGYGRSIVVHPIPDDGVLPYADYFANRIVVAGDSCGVRPDELVRVLHPCTGTLRLAGMNPGDIAAFARQAGILAGELQGDSIRRGPLPGAFDWDSTDEVDQRLKWPLELLWFGGPGGQRTMARHRQELPPSVAAFGRVLVPGEGFVTAVDAYNGLELWSRRATGFQYVSADAQNAYISVGGRVMQCDAQTGRLDKVFDGRVEPIVFSLQQPLTFRSDETIPHRGAIHVAKTADELEITFETVTPEPDDKDCWTLWFDFRERGARLTPSGLGAFPIVVNTASGTLRKFAGFDGAEVPDVTLDRVGQSLRLRIPFDEIRRLTGQMPPDFDMSAELALYQDFQVRLRSRPLTDGRDAWRSGTATFVLDGPANEAASPLAQVPQAERSELPAHAQGWGRMPLHVRHDGNIPRAPLAFQTAPSLGERIQPITGETSLRCYLRGYGCSGTIASATMDFFRSGTIGMYDLADDSGMRNFAGVRPGCRITLLPALGVLFSAEGVGDCFCPYNFSTSLALAPARRQRNEDWALFVDRIRIAPMQHLALNLGAPGDRRDGDCVLWLGYPRQPLMFATGGSFGPQPHAFGLPIALEYQAEGQPVRVNADRVRFEGSQRPWLDASAAMGIARLSLGLTYNEPKSTCLALPAATLPQLDGSLGDAAWTGEPGVPVAVEPRTATDRGRVRVRFDDEHLYFAYEQQPIVDRRGTVAPWAGTAFDVWLKDTAAAVYAQFRVTAQGEKTSSSIRGAIDVPRLTNMTIDGRADDWDGQGLELQLSEGRGTMRLGWTPLGLAMVLRWTQPASDQPASGLRVQLANLQSPALVETVIHAGSPTVAMLRAAIGSPRRDAAGSIDQPTTPSAASSPLVDDSDPALMPLEAFRKSEPLAAPLFIRTDQHEQTVEALVPMDTLGLKPVVGATAGLQVVAYDPAAVDLNITSGAGARRSMFRSGSVLSLVLADAVESAAPLRSTAPKREWFGSLDVFPAPPREMAVEQWSAAIVVDEQSFRAEVAIPIDVLRSAGLSPDRLVAMFQTPVQPPINLDGLYNAFAARAVRVHLGQLPPESAEYAVRLHFAELEDKQPGERVFDIRLQGQTVATSVDIVRDAGGPRRPLVRTFAVSAEGEIVIEFLPQTGQPLLNGLELIRKSPD
ncbi:MAG: PQQ-binding-like beta-propeller repeat protein [Pirellulaceae bacterium]|nr:PQQ-binding-like beta-propeller repeat protein [Pirellulaceae bacterium]